MVISSSPARSNDHSLSAATRSTTSTGFIRRSPRNSMRDMPPPRFRCRVRTRTRPNDLLGSDALEGRRPGRITGAIDYNRFAPSGQNGQRGFIKDSQILETAAARGEIPESNEGGGVGK